MTPRRPSGGSFRRIRRGQARGPREVAPLAVCVAVVMVLAGCASPRNALGTGSSVCFKAIPPAVAAVQRRGSLVGVREVSASALARRRPELAKLGRETLCVVAFHGDYHPGDVPLAPHQETGRYALVAVDNRTSTVVAAWVDQNLPIRFRHPV